jgi:hypothetical protein
MVIVAPVSDKSCCTQCGNNNNNNNNNTIFILTVREHEGETPE